MGYYLLKRVGGGGRDTTTPALGIKHMVVRSSKPIDKGKIAHNVDVIILQ